MLVAAFLVCFTNRTFWSKAVAYLADHPGGVAGLFVIVLALHIALLAAFSVKFLIRPFSIVLITASAIGSWFMDRFGVVIDDDMVRNAAQTTPAEAQHLITPGLALHMLLFAVLPIAALLWIRIVHRPYLQKVPRNLAVIVLCLVVSAGVFVINSKPFTAMLRQHKDLVKSLNPGTPLVGTAKFLLQTSGETDVVAEPLGLDAEIANVGATDKRPRVTIIVAGETARAQNFSLGGYARQTNPELSRQDIVYFPKTTSCGTATAVSIPCMFSNLTRAGYTHDKGLRTETLLDVLKHAGADVVWWDNNTGSKGVADRVTFIDLVKTADGRFCMMGECQDGIFPDRLDTWLDQVEKDSVLVLHTMGSHGPTYYLRYPEAFRTFTPDCRTAELGNCKDEEIVNAYDNSILYTDHVLSSVIETLKKRSAALQTALVYMSDHGESLGENGLYLHGAPYVIAPDVQTHVPFFVWLDDAFTRSMDLDRTCLEATVGMERSHDNLFHSVLGMMNVRTTVYDPALDIFAACRKATPHGQ
ncbi:phosphoethanolamine--lipid A transferase [Rhizobium sp. Leaf384]|uniref:phosphoethanolamine transferase n=1 Tax=Rhizobium sp. Leaf384 TaxID=1736358 RepID=UPI0009E82704|nr:phosphoethanolamine--lipid A transferase [Rhizobium sp. Leaf384]